MTIVMNNIPKCIVTITDGISPTSMPFNEFILFRLKHFPTEKQVLIQLFEKGIDNNVVFPSEVEYYSLGMNLSKINKVIKDIEERYDVIAYHVHEGKSVILFSVASFWKYRSKTIYTLHSTYRNYPFHNKLFSFCASLLARDIVCVSKTSYKYYPTILKRLRGKHVMYIQNGVDTERINAVKGFKSTSEDNLFTMVYVARLVALKRHHMLFEVLKDLPNVRLLLIGQGPLKETLVKMADEYKIKAQVSFLGLLPREKVYETLKESDLYVSTSSYEGLPIGVLEAMGCGIPCIVSDIEQHAEIAETCKSLKLCPDNIEQWIKMINELVYLSTAERRSLGHLNKADVENNFSLVSMHRKYEHLYFQSDKR